MELLDRTLIKSFLHISFDDDDSLLDILGESAEAYVKNHLNISSSFSSSLDDNGMSAAKIASLQICSHWYENRDINGGRTELGDAGLKIINPLRDTL